MQLELILCVLLSGEFRNFALRHPVYAKLFTTYLDQQRYFVYSTERAESEPILPQIVTSVLCFESNEGDFLSTSDKKED